MLLAVTLGWPAQAVVLGAASTRSHLGQPLVAEIQVLDADSGSLSAALAPPEMHQSHGVRAPHYDLGRIDVRVVEKSDGQRVVRVTSQRPVHEPIVQFLVEARDGRGHIVRKLALLVDPVSERAAGPAAAATDAAASHASGPAQEAAVPPPVQQRTASRPSAERRSQARPAVARAQRTASRRARKSAAPGRSNSTKPALRARAKPAVAPAASASTAAPAHQSAPPRPSAVATSAEAEHAQAGDPPSPTKDPVAAESDAAARPDTGLSMTAERPVDPTASEPSASTDSLVGISSAQAATPAATTQEPIGTAAPERSALGPSISSQTLAGAVLLLLGGLFVLLRRRGRRHGASTESLDSVLIATENEEISAFGAQADPARPNSAFAPARSTTGAALAQTPNQDCLAALQADEDVDPLAEADVYIAYGRTDQAKAILEEAVHHHPERAALHLKLMSIHRDQSDALAFKERARILALLTGQIGPAWHEACAIGRRLIPGDSLFIDSEQPPLPKRGIAADPAQPQGQPGLRTPQHGADPRPAERTMPGADLTESYYAELGDTDPGALSFVGQATAAAAGAAEAAHQVDLELFTLSDGEPLGPSEVLEGETSPREAPV
ncbi:MAG TPA: hypothetical protein PKA16_13775 [Ottowia sp.]|uniref:type IV pilus assembly protein FimV n=1 Tax=Ottowia sp. TaxID=1898956 RepID=UPI002B7A52D2|nr:hypothetical protein [Ottowia sp.]HMN22448.1 hypothetical protein [Ottowia sp.]